MAKDYCVPDTNLPGCVEEVCDLAEQGDESALLALKVIHKFYSDERVTGGDPASIIECPLRGCSREIIVALNETSVTRAIDGTNLTTCKRGNPVKNGP